MGDISITKDDVVEAAGCDPWELQSDFASDTDLESMTALSGVFKTGAGEADEAGGVAAYASALEESSGAAGGEPIYGSAAVHLQSTYEDLGAENLENISRILDQVATEAETVLEANENALTHATGLDWQVERHESSANGDYDTFVAWLGEQGAKAEELMSYTIYGETFTGAQGTFPMNAVEEHVRKTHLDLAASFASIVYDGMFERIDDYYGILHQKEGELNEYGYDVAGSPVGFWYTEGRAAHEAEQLEIELNKPNPDPDIVERYTAGLAKIAENVYGDPHNPGDPLRNLSPEEAAYLEEFYNTLSPEAFALLSGQGGPGGGADVGMAAENEALRNAGFENARIALANGINLLTNPDIGGIDPAEERGRVPDSISTFVYPDWENGNERGAEDLKLFNGFGDIMGHASVPPADTFATDMGHAAIDWQELAQLRFYDEDSTEVVNTGSSGLLEAVSLNTGVSAELLNDEDYRDDLFRAEWSDSTGAGSLVRSGTTVPDGVDPNSDEARKYFEAAYNVLSYTGEHGPRMSSLNDLASVDTSDLQQAIGETTLRYMDFISQFSDENGSGFLEPGDSDDPAARVFADLFGQDHRYGFELSREERENVMLYMTEADDHVRDEFRGGVAAWQAVTAYNAFETGENIGSVLGAVGRISGIQEAADLRAIENGMDEDTLKTSVLSGLTTAAGVANSLAGFSGPASLPLTAGSWVVAEASRHMVGTGEEIDLARLESIETGDANVHYIVANAAAAADFQGSSDNRSAREIVEDKYGTSTLPDPATSDYTPSEVNNAVIDIRSEAYGDYASELTDGFNRGRGL
ncbi:putative alpha/beta hydrolase [Streptomyces xiamenensis]